MRAPRRTPWASQSELSELYDMIYSSTADVVSRQQALSRMSVYLSSPSCPTFIHLLHSLLSADLLPAAGSASEKQAVRLTCAMAVVRFINGMVDPLQTGPYARPISHIAATLQIPPSLIALRHRATHEDLPPLPLLKQAIHSAIEYINHYSFLPSLASSSSEPIPRTLRAATLVERWKRIIKSRLKSEISEIEFDREAKRLKREFDDEDIGEVVEALASVGGLIPVARKKRSSIQSGEPTKAALQIWTPLIEHLGSSEPAFIGMLVDQLFLLAQQRPQQGKTDSTGSSVRWSAIVWILWFWSDRRGPSPVPSDVKLRLRRDIMSTMIQADDIWQRFAEEMSEIDPAFASAVNGLDGVLETDAYEAEEGDLKGLEMDVEQSNPGDSEMSGDDAIAQMEARLAQLTKSRRVNTAPVRTIHTNVDPSPGGTGWTRLDDTCWKPCPIGCWGRAG